MQPLLQVRSGQLAESGLFKSIHPLDAPLWKDGRNIIFRDGGPQKGLGWANVDDIGSESPIRGMNAIQDEAGVQRLVFGTADKLFMWVASVLTELKSSLTGYVNQSSTHRATVWSVVPFGNWAVATNGKDPIQVWKTGSSSADLDVNSEFTYAEIIWRYKTHLLAFNTSAGASWFHWSGDDTPEVWTPASDNAAGNLNIRDLNGEIIAACNIADLIAVFSRNQMFLVQYVGSPFYFTYRFALNGIGAVSKACCAEANRRIYGLSEQGFWETDGVTYRYIDTLSVRKFLESTWDEDQLSKVSATYNTNTETVIWSIPTSGGEPTISIGYTIPTQAWTIFDWGRTAWVPQIGAFDRPWAANDTTLCAHNEGVDAHTSELVAYVQTKPLSFGAARYFKTVDLAQVQAHDLAGTFQCRLGVQEELTDSITWTEYKTVDEGFYPIYFEDAPSGVFYTFEFKASGVGSYFRMGGFDVYGTVEGPV